MRVLLDTNILTRSAQPSHPHHDVAVNSVSSLRTRGDALFLVPQNLYEFWVVATRPPGANGLGITPESVQARLTELKRSFTLQPDTPALFTAWEKLVVENRVIGKSAHDARLVAAMKVNGFEGILTFNKVDFRRFGEITVFTPDEVAKRT